MKNLKNIIKIFGLTAFVGVSVTSCDLDLLPLNEVVLEIKMTLTTCFVHAMWACRRAIGCRERLYGVKFVPTM